LSDAWVDVLLERTIVTNAILEVISVGLQLISDSLELKDLLVLSEPLCFNIDEVGLSLWRDGMR
jgi:hypothetical protein